MLPPDLCAQFRRISETLPELWYARRITHAQQKELLRALIANVILTRTTADRVEVKIVWVSGHFTLCEASLPIQRETNLSDWAELVERIRVGFEQGLSDEQIAEALTRDGFYSARTSYVSASKVLKIRLQHRWLRSYDAHRKARQIGEYWTTRGLADKLGVSVRAVLRQIYKHVIPAEHVHRHDESGVYLIDNYPDLLPTLQHALSL